MTVVLKALSGMKIASVTPDIGGMFTKKLRGQLQKRHWRTSANQLATDVISWHTIAAGKATTKASQSSSGWSRGPAQELAHDGVTIAGSPSKVLVVCWRGLSYASPPLIDESGGHLTGTKLSEKIKEHLHPGFG